ncbi:protein translocase subunit SecD [Paenibacillus xanthanilyticus]|uniref:Multifunctional fusion protein n=1 Tax=Paenibacillus xanthanilyticus TaxID=1783531 RepID=A0ABV8JYZ6_9BACL
MRGSRIAGFLLTALISLTVVFATSPTILNGIKLGLDLKGGFEILYEAQPIEEGGTVTKEALQQTAKSLAKRADSFGVTEPEVTTEGTNRIRARIAGVQDETTVREMMKKPAELTFRGPDGKKELLGSDFVEGAAEVAMDEMNQPMILIEVKDKEKLREVSQRLLGQELSIYLDEEMLSNPVVRDVLSAGSATISGNYTMTEAKELAEIINMGALPLKLTEKYTQSVGASLGQQSLEQTLLAGVIATVFILLFMLFVYRVPGFIACITLIIYNWGLLVLYYWMQATLTLPGIAAFVLGIGMAVDANIITAERIREEMRTGKSLLSAMKAGSKSSFRTILDANVTTIVAAGVLYFVGTGAIQGFALTLILSNILSMATNVYLSRFLLKLFIGTGWLSESKHYGVKPADIQKLSDKSGYEDGYYRIFNFTKLRNLFFAISGGITVLGLVFVLAFNFNYGVDFKAGTSLDMVVGKTVTKADAEALFEQAGIMPETLTVGGEGSERVTARFDRVLDSDKGEVKAIKALFVEKYGDGVSIEENTVDPGIARELAVKAIYAILFASIGIIILVSIRFEWRFAVAGIVALFHDVFVVVSIFSIFRLEVNLTFIAAILTIIGYSINDTIVIFDRIRENLRFAKLRTFDDLSRLVNVSISQTLTRSINTGLTVLVASFILLLFGSKSIALFSMAMTLGLAVGMYSSIYIAAQVWLLLKKNSIGRKPAEEGKPQE